MPVFGQREQAQIFDQPFEQRGFAQQPLKLLGLGFIHTILHAFQPPFDDRQRRTQLVRDVGSHLAALAVGGSERARHGIEGLRQLVDLADGRGLYLYVERASGELLRGYGECAQRPTDALHKKQRHQQQTRHQHASGDQEAAQDGPEHRAWTACWRRRRVGRGGWVLHHATRPVVEQECANLPVARLHHNPALQIFC